MSEVGLNVKQNFIHIKKICLFINTFLFVILSRTILFVLHCERSFLYSLCKGKGTVHPCTGTEALYRQYDP